MNRNVKDLDKYTETGGSIKLKKESSELNNWYELEEILHEAHKQSGCNLDKEECSPKAQTEWKKITGRGRGFGCFMREIEGTIKQLGGNLYKDRKSNGDDNEKLSRGCKECNKQLVGEKNWKESLYNINIGDETERKWEKNRFDLCFDCWGKKKESYISLVGEWNEDKDEWKNRKIEIIRHEVRGGAVISQRLLICPTCKKWADEYEEKNKGKIFCSLKCEQNKDKRNNNDDNRQREKERKREREKERKRERDFFPALQNIQKYFTANNIHSITNQDGNLVIVFNKNQNSSHQTITNSQITSSDSSLNQEERIILKKFKEYMEEMSETIMDKQKLEQRIYEISSVNTEKKPNETKIWPWILGGLVIINMIGVAIVLVRNRKRRKNVN